MIVTRRLCQSRVHVHTASAGLMVPVPCSIGLSATTIASSFGKVISGEPSSAELAELQGQLLAPVALHNHVRLDAAVELQSTCSRAMYCTRALLYQAETQGCTDATACAVQRTKT